jgi:Fic/DOC family
MASQVIILPSRLIDSILDHPETPRMIAFGSRDLVSTPLKLADGSRALIIDIDRLVHCPELSNRLSDEVFAILLTSMPLEFPVPEPLPDAIVLHVLNDVEAALMELRRLTGHEKIGIAAAIEAARNMPATLAGASRPTPADPMEDELLQQATDLQARLQPALDALDRKLAAYATEVRKSRLETAVARLGLQADLGAALRLDPVEGGFLPRVSGNHRYGGFERLWLATLNRLAAFQSALDAIHRAARDGSNWLGDSALLPLQATLLNGLTAPERCGCYRTGRMVIQSPFDGSRHDLALPATAVSDAIDAFTRCYDSRLWHGLHPVLRAGLAHCELVRIHPFSDGNGRLARLVLQAMLIEDRLPALPLEAVFFWNRGAYIERTDAAVRNCDLLSFLQWLVKAVEKSIELGRQFTREMAPVRDLLVDSFSDGGPRFAAIAAKQSVSMLVGPDAQFLQRGMIIRDLGRYLDAAGFDAVFCGRFEVIGERMELAYSCPLARDLLAAPAARM